MPSSYTSSNIAANVPLLADSANVVYAFQDYHASIADDIDAKANKASPTFSGTVTLPGEIYFGANDKVEFNDTTNTFTFTADATAGSGNINAASINATANITTSTNIVANVTGAYTSSTVNLFGQASAAVKAGRYYTGSTGYDPNTTTSTATRIIISQNEPATANLAVGDIWIDF